MSNLRWEEFGTLPGDPRENWELICRESVRRHYDRFGSLLTRKQQPGVEFHLKLNKEGSGLGCVGDKWGWQCKWYGRKDLKQDGGLRAHHRRSIEEAIEKSARHVDGLTDWVLWTREKLTADDLRWFEELAAPFTLRHWDSETLAGLLSGPGESLRATWFGELVLNTEVLTERRREALAPIRQRYVEELHVRTRPEEEIEEVLLGPGFVVEVARLQHEMMAGIGQVQACEADAQQEGAEQLHQQTMEAGTSAFEALQRLSTSGIDELPTAEEVEAIGRQAADFQTLVESLADAMDRRRESALGLREVVVAAQGTRRFLGRLATGLRVPLVVVLGSAGAGKTHLAASVSGPDDAARGALVLGRQFDARISDDDLARHAGFGASREEMLEALEAVGVREGRRVPLVIDGINESEDPSAWRIALARLATRLERLEHVFAVVTLRPTYRNLALPPGLPSIELAGFLGLEEEAIRRYFDYYKIDALATSLNWWRPSDPLLLSIFCRTVNPSRETMVGADDLPVSLTKVLDAYLKGVCRQIAGTTEFLEEEIEAALLRLAWRFYEQGAREMEREEVSEALGDRSPAKWKESLRFHLEAEEILIRDVVNQREMVMWNYDLLAGHVIARNLVQQPDLSFGTDAAVEALHQHPLREDVVTGLVGILGTRSSRLLSVFSGFPELVFDVVQAHVYLPADQVSESTLENLRQLFDKRPHDVLEAIERAILRPDHPLNGRVLDRLLLDMPVWQRDLTWTEWMQRRVSTDGLVGSISEKWRLGQTTADDGAAVSWLSWVLTTPQDHLRHMTIQALYRIGKQDPKLLFDRTLEMLRVNDPSVGEGLLAAAYGAAMSCQSLGVEAETALFDFATELRRRMWGDSATEPTSHWLVREYAYRIMQLASWLSGGEFDAPTPAAQPPMPQPLGRVPLLKSDSEAWGEIHRAFGRSLFEKRHEDYVKGIAAYSDELWVTDEIYGRVAELGWNESRFWKAEQEQPDAELFPEVKVTPGRPYGEKYAWVGFYEAVGRLSDGGEVSAPTTWRVLEPSLDPSFPVSPPLPDEELGQHLRPSLWLNSSEDPWSWLKQPLGRQLQGLLYGVTFGGERWLALDGRLSMRDDQTGRELFCDARGTVALGGWEPVATHIESLQRRGHRFPAARADQGCFAGEAPWSPTFDSHSTSAEGTVGPRIIDLDPRGDGPKIEVLSVPYHWRARHSAFNTADIGRLPAKFFSFQCGLRKVPDLPEFVDPEGRPAVRSFSFRGWKGIGGNLLYVREDLLKDYLRQRKGEWGWFVQHDRRILIANPPGEEPGTHRRRFHQTMRLDSAFA